MHECVFFGFYCLMKLEYNFKICYKMKYYVYGKKLRHRSLPKVIYTESTEMQFDICLTVHHWNKWYKHQLDATITVY